MEEKEHKQISLSRFKELIYEDEAVATTILPLISFDEIVYLIIIDKNAKVKILNEHGQLTFFWDIFLTHHWENFISFNMLARLKRLYKWNLIVVQTIAAKLRVMNNLLEQTNGVSFVPLYYIPKQFDFGDEELLYVYAMVNMYRLTYNMYTIDLSGRGVRHFDPQPHNPSFAQSFYPFIRIGLIRFPSETEEGTFIEQYEISYGNSVYTIDASIENNRHELAKRIYSFMKEGPFVIHMIFPFESTTGIYNPKEIQHAVKMDNQFASKKFTFLYTTHPHQIRIERK